MTAPEPGSEAPSGSKPCVAAPPPGFDAVAATPEDLARHCLPPRPDPRCTPIAFANWVRALASRPKFPHRAESDLSLSVLSTWTNRSVSQASSRNWSGGVVRPRDLGRMVLVQGRWIVPDAPRCDGVDTAASVWLGLDGYDPASRLMPQIGTAQIPPGISIDPLPEQFAWWQIWHPNSRLKRIRVALRRGDAIYAQVHLLASGMACLFLKNETANEAFCTWQPIPAESARRRFERRTAEWVVERPLTPKGKEDNKNLIARPLSDYGETAFTGCNAVTVDDDGRAREFQLQRAHLVRMNAWDDPVVRGRVVSRAARIGDDALHMTYVRPPHAAGRHAA